MGQSMRDGESASHLLTSDIRPQMAKADLRKAETDWREHVGQAIERARTLSGKSLKEFADACDRDERQVARWIAGTERPQIDAIFASEPLRQSLVVALAELAGPDVAVETVVRVTRRTA